MSNLKANLQMHACVLVWGFTAILGKVISLSALNLVVWRTALTALFLLLMALMINRKVANWYRVKGAETESNFPPIADLRLMAITGSLISLHWVAFYAAVKLSNASIGVICMAFAPIFSALLMPLFAQGKFAWRDLALACSILPGMALVVGGIDTRMYMGIAAGILAALLVALFAIFNKQLVSRYSILPLSLVQISIGCLVLLPISLLVGPGLSFPPSSDWLWLVIFAFVCTALPFAIASNALRKLSVFSAQFAVNLEPVYGILFAAWLLNETAQLNASFYLGASMIVIAVFTQGIVSRKEAN